MPIRDAINSWLFAALLVLLVLSLVVHSLTYFNYDPHELSLSLWYGLQLCSVAAFTPAIIVNRRHDQKHPWPDQTKNKTLPRIDNVIAICFGLSLFYAIFNWMFTDYFLLHGATPELVNGQYAMGSHGHFTTVSKEVFMKALVYEARMNSGHWMAFYLLAISTWLWRLREPAD
jgi:hypothetical protein